VGYEWDADIQDCKLKGATRGACPVGTDKAGLAIPADQDIASWCNCGEGQTWDFRPVLVRRIMPRAY
jgi:hypothetical protein